MKKILFIFLILISLILFGLLVVITINASSLPEKAKTIGFIVIGYISIILFAFSWFKLFKE
ncbi:MAG TPA: hypothetical protein GXZ48_07350 [Acholeplasmataceae bacterium]|nr:hypothetical protein [Acholeplasmataceae bacterium]